MIGNFPQTLRHIGPINATRAIAHAKQRELRHPVLDKLVM
jgi:hypothetical protein